MGGATTDAIWAGQPLMLMIILQASIKVSSTENGIIFGNIGERNDPVREVHTFDMALLCHQCTISLDPLRTATVLC